MPYRNRLYQLAGGVCLAWAVVVCPHRLTAQPAEGQTSGQKEPVNENWQDDSRPSGTAANSQADTGPDIDLSLNGFPIELWVRRIAKDIISDAREADDDWERQNSQEDLEAQKDMASWTFWITLIGGLQAVLTGVGVGLVYSTLKETRAATKAALSAAEAGQRTVQVAEETNAISRDAAAKQLRAYMSVGPAGVGYNFLEDRPLIFVKQKNNGQTPAQNVRYAITAKTLSVPQERQLPYAGEVGPGTNVVHPGHEFTVHTQCDDITLEQLQEIAQNPQGKIFIATRIEYTDIFGKRHLTRASWSYEWGALAAGVAASREAQYKDRSATGGISVAFSYTDCHNDIVEQDE